MYLEDKYQLNCVGFNKNFIVVYEREYNQVLLLINLGKKRERERERKRERDRELQEFGFWSLKLSVG